MANDLPSPSVSIASGLFGRFPLKYAVPNAVTSIGLLTGLLSIMNTMAGDYESAAWLILLCCLLDKLDGTVARALGASSKFGVELDSFSDFVTFGIAPAFLLLGLATKDPRYSAYWATPAGLWFVRASSAFLILTSGLRLAKFNVMTETIGSKLFLGIPTTHVGGMIASYLLVAWKYQWPAASVAAVPIAIWLIGLWEVSNIPLPKVRKTSSKAYNIFIAVNALGVYVTVPLRILPEYPLVFSIGYALIGTTWAILFMKPDLTEEAA